MSWDLQRLLKIVKDTTICYRKGEEHIVRKTDNVIVEEHWNMSHMDDVNNEMEKVDVHFMIIGVNRKKAEQYKDDLYKILKDYPDNGNPLQEGPSYIHMGAVVDSQEIAFRLFALGEVLGFWKVLTPASMGMKGPEANQLAGMGFVYISEFKSE